MPWLGRAVVKHGIGGRVFGIVGVCCLAFFGEMFGGSGGGLGIELGVNGGEWSFAGYCSLRGWVLFWVRLERVLCVMVAAIT